MGSNKDIKNAITCFLILGLVVTQVPHVEGKTCCQGSWGRTCYEGCLVLAIAALKTTATAGCAKTCGCIIISENSSCPSDYPALFMRNHSDPDSIPNAIQLCNSGCMSSVCDNMNNVHRGEVDAELCGGACASFCNQISVSESVAA
ncbi:hypothetical protein ACQ4PT_047329 [Festuca glaucescens]